MRNSRGVPTPYRTRDTVAHNFSHLRGNDGGAGSVRARPVDVPAAQTEHRKA